ncbi:hypothetical protein [Mycobacterium yunnanensis]|nr:hypothetical protein [Mycobacterium yunnanensis]
MSDLDEWRLEVRGMSERDRLVTAMDVRTADGMSAADAEDQR